MSVFQQVSDLTQNGVAATIVGMVNLGAISTVFFQSMRHRIKHVRELADVKDELKERITTGNREVRNEVQATVSDCEIQVRDMDARVRSCEQWQAKRDEK